MSKTAQQKYDHAVRKQNKWDRIAAKLRNNAEVKSLSLQERTLGQIFGVGNTPQHFRVPTETELKAPGCPNIFIGVGGEWDLSSQALPSPAGKDLLSLRQDAASSSRWRGIYTVIARRLGLSPAHVRNVALGLRSSRRVEEELAAEIEKRELAA